MHGQCEDGGHPMQKYTCLHCPFPTQQWGLLLGRRQGHLQGHAWSHCRYDARTLCA